jgi:hypothetical protein
MAYQIKTFSPDYLQEQVEIGDYNLSQWLGARQSPVSRLEQVYSSPDFDPETRFYALQDSQVVGFLTSKIRKEGTEADLEFPILSAGFEDAEEQLMSHAMDSLKSKGVRTLYSRVSREWGDTLNLANKYGYHLESLKWKNARLKVENYIGSSSMDGVDEVTEKDFDDVRQVMISFRENSEKEAQAQIDKLVEISERVTSWKIIREEGKIVGHDHLVEDILDGSRARMNAIFSTGDEIRDRIMNSHVIAAKKAGIPLIENVFWGPTENLDKPYEAYGFEVAELWSYEKQL